MKINPPVFITSVVLVLAFLAFGSLLGDTAAWVFPAAVDFCADYFGWFYVVAIAFFLVFVLGIAASRFGKIRLGPDDARPEFSRLSWFAMLFSAGMGIGLLFYSVAEPILHYLNPPSGEGLSAKAAREALPITFFHWGLHAWSVYVATGLALSYFAYRKGLPLALRSVFQPFLGDRIHGFAGHAIDILAVLGTVFGLATSLGLGAIQISTGLDFLFDIEPDQQTQLAIVGIVTLAATASLVSGVHRGIRRLSELNLILASVLLLFVFAVGPTAFIARSFFADLGTYARDFVSRSFSAGLLGVTEWEKAWTLFYWAWWMAWAPFVGLFIARISRGRTIREFVLGVLLVPTLATFVWLSVFGDTALYLELVAGVDISGAVSRSVSTAIYVVLEQLPFAAPLSLLAVVVVGVFFVTSSDSGSYVVDMLTSGGQPDSPVWQRIFWATTEGAVAAVLLVAVGHGGLVALQAAVIALGAPFSLLLVGMCVSLGIALRGDRGRGPGAGSTGPD